jgi:predicted XRE-type DNA-binding protein
MDAFKRAIGDRPADAPAAAGGSPNPFSTLERFPTLADARELLVDEALRRAEGSQSVAARLLGISQSAVSRWLKGRRQRA